MHLWSNLSLTTSLWTWTKFNVGNCGVLLGSEEPHPERPSTHRIRSDSSPSRWTNNARRTHLRHRLFLAARIGNLTNPGFSQIILQENKSRRDQAAVKMNDWL
jgi:hypothetical protein